MNPPREPPHIAVLPASAPQAAACRSAVAAGGGIVTDDVAAASAIVWLSESDPLPLIQLLDSGPSINWVQLPWAGVEPFARSGVFDRGVRFTCAKGAYGEQVAEHALYLVLACLRHARVQLSTPQWTPVQVRSLSRLRVTVLGAGGIAGNLVRMLQPMDCRVTVLRRTIGPLAGARVRSIDEVEDVLPETDVLVLALPLTPATVNLIDASKIGLLPAGAVLINVARGGIVDTDALLAALRANHLAAAGLDVTAPEPLPADHPLWQMKNVVITSHSADSLAYVTERLAERVRENVVRFAAGLELIGMVDPISGY